MRLTLLLDIALHKPGYMLKKILVLTTLILSTTLGFCQEKGQLLIGGGFFYDMQDQTENGVKTQENFLSISPQFGLMVSNRIATGVVLDYQINNSKQSDANFSSNSTQYSMFVGAFGRLHGNFTEKILFTTQIQFGKTFLLRDDSSNKLQSFATSADVGLLYFVAKRAALGLKVLSINYGFMKDEDIDLDQSAFRIDYNVLNPRFEVVFYL